VKQRPLQKWQAAGNDFLVDLVSGPTSGWWTPKRAAAVCNRHFGIGADGVLVVHVAGAIPRMELYNADGSMAEMSGNGIRCVAAAVHRSTNASWDEITIETGAGLRNVALVMDDLSGFGTVDMGLVTFGDTLDDTLGTAFVGNPHVVLLDHARWNTSEREDVANVLSSKVGGANVEFITVVGENVLAQQVYERGVGWTQACGTGSVAAAAVAQRSGLVGKKVTVRNPGGDLEVKLKRKQTLLTGPVAYVADVTWNL